MCELVRGLGLDLAELEGDTVVVAEEDRGDAGPLLAGLLWKGLKGSAQCLVVCSRRPQRYYRRSAHALSAPLSRLHCLQAAEVLQAPLPQGPYRLLAERISALRPFPVFLVIDDLSDLFNLGLSLQEVVSFIHYLRNSLLPNDTLIVSLHSNTSDPEQQYMKYFMGHCADLRLTVRALETGFCREVSGSIELVKKDSTSVTGWGSLAVYHYKTGDRTIKIFPPGNISFSYTV